MESAIIRNIRHSKHLQDECQALELAKKRTETDMKERMNVFAKQSCVTINRLIKTSPKLNTKNDNHRSTTARNGDLLSFHELAYRVRAKESQQRLEETQQVNEDFPHHAPTHSMLDRSTGDMRKSHEKVFVSKSFEGNKDGLRSPFVKRSKSKPESNQSNEASDVLLSKSRNIFSPEEFEAEDSLSNSSASPTSFEVGNIKKSPLTKHLSGQIAAEDSSHRKQGIR